MLKNNIRIERAKANITQQTLANEVKTSRQTINKVEKGDTIPSVSLAMRIARFFGITVNEIFEEDEKN